MAQLKFKVEEPFVSKSGLKHRGWTDTAIEKFLKAPDKEVDNPHYKCAPKMKLYAMKRVERVEASARFARFASSSAKRKASASKAVSTKIDRLVKEINKLHIEVKKMEWLDLVKLAVDNYNEHHSWIAYERGYDDWRPATVNSEVGFLARIAVNYLRHQMTDYEEKIERMFGKTGTKAGYILLNRKIYGAIDKAYPNLEWECANQMKRKGREQGVFSNESNGTCPCNERKVFEPTAHYPSW
jgi:hypothetical protein